MGEFPEVGTEGTCNRPVYDVTENKSYPCSRPGTLQRDPFAWELWGSEDYMYFCEDHYAQRRDDV